MGVFDFLKRDKKPIRKRMYAGANSGRLFSDFFAPSNTADGELRYSLKTLRNRSRDLYRNNSYAKRYFHVLETMVVGEKGFTVQVRGRDENGELDAPGNKVIENAFKRWSKIGNCDVTGRMSWLDAQRFAIQNLARDGEVFIQKVRGGNYRDGFAIQFIESDLIDHEKNDTAPNGNEIRMGVEVDQYQRPTAYYVLTDHPDDTYFPGHQNNRKHIRIPADDIIHVYKPTRSYQTRGEPFLAPVIADLKMLHGFLEAELISARASSAKFGIITTPSGEDFVGDAETDEGVPVIDFSPGSVHQLPKGHEFDIIDVQHPNSAFDSFVQTILRGVASGLNVSYTSLANDLKGVSYSSIRQGTIEERDHMKMLQGFLIQHFCEPIFFSWLKSAMDFGDMPLPISKFDKFADNTHFRGRGFSWVDPQREISANVAALQNGMVSMNDIAANYGRDVEELFEQIQSDKKMAERYGLKMAFEPFGGGQSPYGPSKIDPEELGED